MTTRWAGRTTPGSIILSSAGNAISTAWARPPSTPNMEVSINSSAGTPTRRRCQRWLVSMRTQSAPPPAAACLVSGSNATIWGLGVVQFVNSAEMQLYTAYRHYEPDVSLSTRRGAGVGSVPLDPFQTIMTGALIDF